MHNLSETASFDPDVTVPDDGVDFRTAASVNGPFQALTNRARYLIGLFDGSVFGFAYILRGTLRVIDFAEFLAGARIDGTAELDVVTVASTTELNGDLSVNANVGVGGFTSLREMVCTEGIVNGSSTIGITLADDHLVRASTRHQAPVSCNAAAPLSLSAVLNLAGGCAATSVIACTGAGRIRRAAVITAQSGAQTISPQQTNTYIAATLTADLDLTISSTGSLEGDTLKIRNASTSFFLSVFAPGGGTIITLKNAVGENDSVELVYISGLWYIASRNYVG